MPLIGSTHARSGHILSLGLARFQEVLTPKDFETIARQTGCTPKKERPLTPQVVFWLMACVGAGRQPQGRLVAFCSVFTGFCTAFKFVPLRFSEHTVLRHLISQLKINDLLLLDRGFFSLRHHLGHRAA
ncbi:MAG TPA: hypothetical protein VHP11_01200 [Tepidisphaeraceae bacterium]|nr:hypothetical protein [Tepidisphaeraceae bacterium]